ncbi:MAG TPA: WYL domain-containing protein, partial [Candidatus Limnocylindrales bacterium]
DFDLAAYWAESTAAYEQSTPTTEVSLLVRSERTGRLRDVVGARVMDEADRLPEIAQDGWLGLRLRLDWPDEIAGHLMSMGPDIEVIEPPELRAEMSQLAAQLIERYAAS